MSVAREKPESYMLQLVAYFFWLKKNGELLLCKVHIVICLKNDEFLFCKVQIIIFVRRSNRSKL
jgi:uncharacterized membrane protein